MPANPRALTINPQAAKLPFPPEYGHPVRLVLKKYAPTIANTATTGRLVGSDNLEPPTMLEPFTLDRFDHGERR